LWQQQLANLMLDWLAGDDGMVACLDKLTYTGDRQNLARLDGDARHLFVHRHIDDSEW
jgi:dTDP-glucose 4,6-dehydratase